MLPIKSTNSRLLLAWSSIMLIACNTSPHQLTAITKPAPNIVLIMTDDQGYGDIGHLSPEENMPMSSG